MNCIGKVADLKAEQMPKVSGMVVLGDSEGYLWTMKAAELQDSAT